MWSRKICYQRGRADAHTAGCSRVSAHHQTLAIANKCVRVELKLLIVLLELGIYHWGI